MKSLVVAAAIALGVAGSAAAQGSHRVGGYYRSNGTYVAPHYQTNPDGNRFNNWSTQGNVNPYTGQMGTRSPYPTYSAPTYSAPMYRAPSYPAPVYQAPVYGYAPPTYGYTAPQGCYGYGC